MNLALSAALTAAERGWPVVPIHTPTFDPHRPCSCAAERCANIGKHPRTAHGLKAATTDPDIIREWWDRWPDANIAVRTGRVAGIWVLDIDADTPGVEFLNALQERHGPLPPTLQARSGGGGLHFYFRYNDRLSAWLDAERLLLPSRAGIRPTSHPELGPVKGFDVRSDGGYILLPPSLHASGNRYVWLP